MLSEELCIALGMVLERAGQARHEFITLNICCWVCFMTLCRPKF